MDAVCSFVAGHKKWKAEQMLCFNDMVVHTLLCNPDFKITDSTLDGALARNILSLGERVGYLDAARLERSREQLLDTDFPSYEGTECFIRHIVGAVNATSVSMDLKVCH
jgi:hypothetical protein